MAKRLKLSLKASRKIFSAAGAKINSLNSHYSPMRGGYRI